MGGLSLAKKYGCSACDQACAAVTPNSSALAPTIQRNLAEMVSGLKTDLGNAADQVGRAADYFKGLGDYSGASKYQGWYDAVKDSLAKEGVQYAVKGAGGVIGAGTAFKLWQWLTSK